MKQTNKQTNKLSFFAIIAIVLVSFFSSCSKENDTLPHTEPYLSFNSVEEYNATLTKVLAMTEEQRLAWEKQQGFTSYKTKSKEIYDLIVLKDINSIEELKNEIVPYKNYVTLEKDESGEYTLEMNAYTRKDYCVTNSQKIIKIGDYFFKYFTDATISVHKSHCSILEKINSINDITPELEKIVAIDKKENIALPKSDFYDCKNIKSHEETVTDGRNRTKLIVEIDLSKIPYTINGLTFYYKTFEARCEVRAYLRTAGIWYHAKRTLSCDIIADIIIPFVSPTKQRFYFQELGKNDYAITKTWIPQTIYTNDSEIPSFDYIYAWGDTPDTPTAWINCFKL